MHHRTLLALAAVATVATASVDIAEARPRPHSRKFVANKTFGLGLMVGAPTAISGKYFYSRSNAFDFGVGGIRYYRNHNGVHLHADHLWHPVSLASNPDFELPLYFGIGARIFDFDGGGTAVGLRVPIGIALDFNKVPIDVFLEFALVVDTYFDYAGDSRYADFNGALGFRYWFGS